MPMSPRLLRPLARQAGALPPATDPYFSSVSLLLHFDGSIADASSNNLSITVEGDVAISTAQSKFGSGSCLFDADGDGLLLADSPLLTAGSGDFTAEAWVRPATNSGVLGIFSKRSFTSESGLEFVCYALNGYSYLVVSENGTNWSYNSAGSEAIPADQWTHVAFVKNGTSVAVYVNGALSQSGTLGGNVYDGNESFFIGSGGYDGHLFDGYIDEVRVTKVARYTAAFTPPDAPFPNQ